MKKYCVCLIIALCCTGTLPAVTITPYQGTVVAGSRYAYALPVAPFAAVAPSVVAASPDNIRMATQSVFNASATPAMSTALPSVSVPLPSKNIRPAVVPQVQTERLQFGYTPAVAYTGVHSLNPLQRRGAPPTSGSAFAAWLQSVGQGALVNTDNGIGYYDMNLLYDLWLNNPSHGDMPGTWDAFLDWFNNNSNVRVPLTDTPLFMLLLMGCYMAYAVNHKKPSKNKPS
ncbi:MAG: hypothetical protein ACI3Z5_02080 [Paludibacteraceae bacterium]